MTIRKVDVWLENPFTLSFFPEVFKEAENIGGKRKNLKPFVNIMDEFCDNASTGNRAGINQKNETGRRFFSH
ncbi:MAG: hypothetical protein IJ196_04800 [Prevotella sp.]|nr:hypothetical protein [Prevotella sp.]